MGSEMTFSEALVQVLVELAPSFLTLCVIFVVLSWVRLAVDAMSARGL